MHDACKRKICRVGNRVRTCGYLAMKEAQRRMWRIASMATSCCRPWPPCSTPEEAEGGAAAAAMAPEQANSERHLMQSWNDE